MAERYTPMADQGLSSKQVEERFANGLYNEQCGAASKTAEQIIKDNVFTFFNLIFAVLSVLLIIIGDIEQMTFMPIIVINTVIGIIQELKAKSTLDKLSVIAASKVSAVRDGQKIKINIDEIVLDDIIILSAGNQICADSFVREGSLEVNEALLTGESDVVVKQPGDTLYSGSFVVSGMAYTQVEHVGRDNIAYKITAQAKELNIRPSELRRTLNRILKIVSFLIIPLGVGLFVTHYYVQELPYDVSIFKMIAAVMGMIPDGLILLTTIALAVGVINLSRKQTLVHDLFCIETLARVDVLCLDKTGTLTEGVMKVDETIPLADVDIDEIMGNLIRNLPDTNATFMALKDSFEIRATYYPAEVVPFSSERKYSGASFRDRGSYIIGAFEFMFAENEYTEIRRQVEDYTKEGVRVITLAQSRYMMTGSGLLPPGLVPCALILIHDVIRKEAPQTLSFFAAQGVDLMVISGDHPATVAHIAQRTGMPGANNYIDATTLKSYEDLSEAILFYKVFGRVTPSQKKMIVKALQAAGRTVAMTGDGVNDVPALKEADCGIAMASGSDAAKNSANIVLLDSNFSSMPAIVKEGRRVINNIQSAASLFLVKTLFSFVLTLIALIFAVPYPFEPIHLTIIAFFAVGAPTFVLSMEPNYEMIRSGFFRNVIKNALIGAITIITFIIITTITTVNMDFSEPVRFTMCAITTGIVSLYMIRQVYPLTTKWRKIVFTTMFGSYLFMMLFMQKIMKFANLPYIPYMMIIIFVILTPKLIEFVGITVEKGDKILGRFKHGKG